MSETGLSSSSQVLRPDKRKVLLLLLISIAFVAIGTIMEDDIAGWACFGFFALCAIVFAVQLIPGSSYLELSDKGFVVCSLFRKGPLHSWHDVGEFAAEVVPGSGKKMVLYDCYKHSKSQLRRSSRTIAGYSDALPDTYGLKAEELAALMNLRRSSVILATSRSAE